MSAPLAPSAPRTKRGTDSDLEFKRSDLAWYKFYIMEDHAYDDVPDVFKDRLDDERFKNKVATAIRRLIAKMQDDHAIDMEKRTDLWIKIKAFVGDIDNDSDGDDLDWDAFCGTLTADENQLFDTLRITSSYASAACVQTDEVRRQENCPICLGRIYFPNGELCECTDGDSLLGVWQVGE